MEQRYRVLRVIGTLYKVLAVIVAVVVVLALVGGTLAAFLGGGRWMMGRFDDGPRMGLAAVGMAAWWFAALLYGTIITVTLYAMGEGLGVLLAVEENTRRAAELIAGQSAPSTAESKRTRTK